MDREIPLPAHDWVNAGLIIVSAVIFLITTALNGLAGSGAGVPSIFYSTVGDISDKYQLFITPAGFTFIIWSVIYLWLAATLFIFIITICINTQFGSYNTKISTHHISIVHMQAIPEPWYCHPCSHSHTGY